MLEDVTLATFEPHLGSSFTVEIEDDTRVELRLIEASALGAPPDRAAGAPTARDPFSVVFRGPRRPVLAQRIHPLQHPSLGRLDIFIVPIGPDREGMCYQAIFT